MKTKTRTLFLTLSISASCFSKQIQIDTSGQKKYLPGDTLPEKAESIGSVIIQSKSSRENVSAVYNIMRKSLVVTDGVSSESIKKTPDATIGDVLKRVSGVTVQNNKFVIVRGLPDRYNSTLVNGGFILPTEPDRKSFSFDIIPSNLIDNLLVYKSASANLPGDFSGGLVDVTTMGVKGKSFHNLTFGVGLGSLSSFRNFYTFGHSDLSSQFPTTYQFRSGSLSSRKEWTSILGGPSGYKPSEITSPTNYNINYNLGIKKKRLNLVGSLTYRSNHSISYSTRKDYENGDQVSYLLRDTQYSRINLLSGILNGEYTAKKYSIQSKNIFSSQTENIFQKRGGSNFDNGLDISTSAYNTTVKNLFNSQLTLKTKGISTEGTFGMVSRSQPDYRIDPKSKLTGSDENYSINWRETYRFWSRMNDMSYGIKSDYSSKNFKSGISYWGKSRDFSARVFRYSSENLLDEITNNTDRYSAGFHLISAYGLWEGAFKKVKISSGLRNESNLFTVNTSDFSGSPVKVRKFYNNILPSFNLVVKEGSKSNIRMSGSRTVVRPEFREVANFSYYDFTRNAQIVGNPKLIQSDVYNGDIKYEYFPTSDQIVSVGFFGKRISSPIEQTVSEGSTPSNFILTFTNSNQATIFGLEGEIRKRIGKFGTVYSNFSLVTSEVKTSIGTRPLQGQSPFTLNIGANFDIKGVSVNITENIIGSRISSVGFIGYPDIYENTRGVLDLSLQYKKKNLIWKLNVRNILPQNIVLYQNSSREMVRTTTESNFSFSLTYNIK
jgi:hypothetical protein